MTPTAASELAEAVAADGFGAHRAELLTFLAAARRRGVPRLLLLIVADETESSIARLRALGRVVGEFDRLPEVVDVDAGVPDVVVVPEPVPTSADALAGCGVSVA